MNRAYKIILSIFIISCSVLCMPFSYINASGLSLSAPFLGVNIYIKDKDYNVKYTFKGSPEIEQDGNHIWKCTGYTNGACNAYETRTLEGVVFENNYNILFNNAFLEPSFYNYEYITELEFILDNEYKGYFNFKYTISGSSTQYSDKLYVNGSSVKYTIDRKNIETINITTMNLKLVTDPIMYLFPIESYNFIYSFIEQGYEQTSIDQYSNTYMFPIFNMKNGQAIYRRYLYKGEKVQIVYATNKALSTSDFTFSSSNYTDLVVTSINRSTSVNNSNWKGIYRLNFECTATSTQQIKLATDVEKFIPIYANVIGNSNGLYDMPVSTDFALEFMVQNKLLNDINIIAQGNNQSQSSVNSATTTNQQAQSTFEQEEQLINIQEQTMQQNLDNLDIQNKNNNLFGNSKFIASAQWVKTQFDWFTNDNAFGYLITFSLVIGLALVIVGKLRG